MYALHLDGRDVDDLLVAEAHAGFVQQPGDRHFQHYRLCNTRMRGRKEHVRFLNTNESKEIQCALLFSIFAV